MSNLIKVRKFNNYGMEIARGVIEKKEDFLSSSLQEADTTEPCLDLEIDLDFDFETNFDLAKYLNQQIGEGIDLENEDAGMWTWIFFAYYKKLMRYKENKPNPLSNSEHYIFQLRGNLADGSYRHFIYSWYMAYSRWGDKAIALMGTKQSASQWGDFEEQFLSRKGIYQFFDLFYETFWDSTNNRTIDDLSNGYISKKEAKMDSPPTL